MRITLWGTRGSVSSAGPSTVRYGGETSCAGIEANTGELLILDAGSGIRKLGAALTAGTRIDILLTHLHMDHIQGLGFFAPLVNDSADVHIWGPASYRGSLRGELIRYLSPPLFPMRLRDRARVEVHDLFPGELQIGPFAVKTDYVIHPGRTLGFRIEADGGSLAYLPDHEPALGWHRFPLSPRWLSGYALARGVDHLIHDAQYTPETYGERIGFGHSTLDDAVRFATAAGVHHLCTFHHDPSHADDVLHAREEAARRSGELAFNFTSGLEGSTFDAPS